MIRKTEQGLIYSCLEADLVGGLPPVRVNNIPVSNDSLCYVIDSATKKVTSMFRFYEGVWFTIPMLLNPHPITFNPNDVMKVMTEEDTILNVDVTNIVNVMSVKERKIDAGRMFNVSKYYSAVADDGYALLRIKSGSNIKNHIKTFVYSNGECNIKVYKGSTYEVAGDGTEIDIVNVNEGSVVTSASTAYYAPTINVAGDVVKTLTINVYNGDYLVNEYLENKESDYLIEVQNVSGGACNISINVEFYEEDIPVT